MCRSRGRHRLDADNVFSSVLGAGHELLLLALLLLATVASPTVAGQGLEVATSGGAAPQGQSSQSSEHATLRIPAYGLALLCAAVSAIILVIAIGLCAQHKTKQDARDAALSDAEKAQTAQQTQETSKHSATHFLTQSLPPSQSTHVGPASVGVGAGGRSSAQHGGGSTATNDRGDRLLGTGSMQESQALDDGSGDAHVPVLPAGSPALSDVLLDMNLERDGIEIDRSQKGFLGKGGFATVYRGTYQGQPVAVKMVKANSSQPADLAKELKQLRTELTILSRVRHPNIVRLYGGCLSPPNFFLVEELMEGTLDKLIHVRRKNTPLTVRETITFALDVATGLSYLHPTIVHRDLKPANILINSDKRAKISDFGLARYKMKEYLSTKNIDAGTTAYIAPECFMSMEHPESVELRQQVTHKTDVYALGVIIWEMCMGKRPWAGLPTIVIAYQVALRLLRPNMPEPGPQFPRALQTLVQDCWAQDPKERPTSAEVVVRLQELLKDLDDGKLEVAPDQPIPVTEVVDVPDVAEVDSQEAQRVWAQVLQQATQTNKRAGPAELLAALKQAEKQRAQQQQAAAAAAAAQQAAATQGASAQGGGIGGGAGDVSGLGHNNHSSPASNNNALHIPAGGIPALYRVKGAVDEPEASTASLVTQEGVVMKVDF